MFNKIQNYLLLRHPLLWNIKIVPILAATLGINLLFFLIGFGKGSLNFTKSNSSYRLDDDTPTIIFFSILLSLIVLIVWLVYYFRNNAFKSFYPKSSASLYKEWLLILLISFLNCTYTAAFMWGQDARRTSYFSAEETQHRLDILTMASLFTEYSLEEAYADVAPVMDTIATVEAVPEAVEEKKTSLLHKQVQGFGYYHGGGMVRRYKGYLNRDSINNERVKKWLMNNRRDSVVWLFTEFDKIAKDHGAKSNVTPEQWANLVYHSPEFTDYELVATSNGTDDDEYGRYTSRLYTPKYYVPYKALHYNYDQIHESRYRPFITYESVLGYLIAAFSCSLLIFSFRVTSGRGWLIALVSVGIAAILVGLMSLVMQSGTAYAVIWLMIIAGLAIYYLSITAQKAGKGVTDIVLNALLWLLGIVIPLICGIIVANRNYSLEYWEKRSGLGWWIEQHLLEIAYFNLAFIVGYMFFLSISIKKWRGISES